jgi:hypothetical protein
MSLVKAPENDNNNSEGLTDVANADKNHRFGQTFETSCLQDPISCLCKIVMAIQASDGQHREALTTWIENGNKSRLFILQNMSVEIKPMQLL